MITRNLFRMFLVLSVAAFAAFACDGDDDDDNGDVTPAADETPADGAAGTVSVLGIWGDEELVSFEAMVAPWPGTMDFTGTRDITALLTARVEGGSPPDVALPAEIGLFQEFARNGDLVPLSECPGLVEEIEANYPQAFIDLGTVNGELYGFFMKADTKATVWYNPQFFTDNGFEPLDESATFDDLIALSDQILAAGTPPWSNGQEAGAGTGFPGSDTIQQILINDAGEEVYDAVVDGTTPYTDAAVRDAWEKFGQLVLTDGYTSQGGAQGVIATAFMDSSFPPFQSPPQAGMVHLGGFAGGFIADQFPDAVPGETYDFFPWPGGAVTGGANIAYAFNSEPATCSFLMHIVSAEAQQIWVERGGFTSVNREVSLDGYADDVARNAAQQLLEAEVFRFDHDDLLGGAMQQALFAGVTSYLTNPGNLDSILQGIEAARGQAPAEEEPAEEEPAEETPTE